MIRRLSPEDATTIVDCFRRVYGASYANELFYDAGRLAEAMLAERIGCVGALDEAGVLIAHMAMTVLPGAQIVELGNTVVDPVARGRGLAWQVGAELEAWSTELGYRGYLHYPTTSHHIMQRQSVKSGFEIGLMLGYIPAETNGRVTGRQPVGRQAATIVYEALGDGGASRKRVGAYLPEYGAGLVRDFARATGLERSWLASHEPAQGVSDAHIVHFAKRGLIRMNVDRVGADLGGRIEELEESRSEANSGRAALARDRFCGGVACWQIDFSMEDPGIERGVEAARGHGYWFCGWLPGYGRTDVFRMQQVDRTVTDMSPDLVNPVARSLLAMVPAGG